MAGFLCLNLIPVILVNVPVVNNKSGPAEDVERNHPPPVHGVAFSGARGHRCCWARLRAARLESLLSALAVVAPLANE